MIQDVTFASSEMEIGLNLGKKDISETREWEDIQVEKYTEKDDENIPKELWKLKPGKGSRRKSIYRKNGRRNSSCSV